MKHSKRLFARSALALLLAVCVLSGGLMLMGMAEIEESDLNPESLAPDVSALLPEEENIITDTTVPVPQEQLSGKFGEYSFVSETDGKSVVSIFSEEQINDFVYRRENGEWFSLSAEDMLFIIDDTVKLFTTYDFVTVTDLEGKTVTYPGIKFYSSDDYKNCFGGLDFGTNEYSFDIEKDMWKVIKTRATVLNSASFKDTNGFCVFTDIKEPVQEDDFWYVVKFAISYYYHEITAYHEQYRSLYEETLAPYDTGMFYFGNGNSVDYIEKLNCKDNDAEIRLYSDGLIPENLDTVKYDADGKSIIIELWDIKGEKMVARLRYDGEENGKIVSDIEGLWEGFKAYLHSEDYRKVSGEEYMNSVSDYRIAVFFVGMNGLHGNKKVSALRFGADDYQDNCQLHFGGGIDEMAEPCQLSGSQAMADYVIALLQQELVTE